MIPGSANPLLLAAEAAEAGPYQISRSVRFNSSDSAYLSRTPASAGNRKTWTWAGWVKRSGLGTDQVLFDCRPVTSDSQFTIFYLKASNTLELSGPTTTWRTTTQLFRDASAWYHIVLALDTTQATAADRIKIYINGSQVTDFATSANPSQNVDLGINQASLHCIGASSGGSPAGFLSGYLADVHLIDGQALDPTSFTEVDATTGQLVPIEYANPYTVGTVQFAYNASSTAMDSASTSLTLDVTGYSYSTWTGSVLSSAVGGANSVKVLRSTSGDPVVWAVSTTNSIPYLWLSQDGINWTSPGTTYTTNGITVYLTAPYLGFAGGSNTNVWTIGSDVDGPNTFHLPFSDNSTAAALGTDTSGNGNDWTLNNISVNSSIYNYSPQLTSSNGFYGTSIVTKGFDGNSATFAFANPNGTLTFNAASFGITVTNSLVIGQFAGGTNATYTVKVNGTTVVNNLFLPAGNASAAQNVNLASSLSKPFTLSSIEIISVSSNAQPGINTIAVDGVILVDASDPGNDSLVDTPTSYGTDTGAGGEVRGNYCTWNPLGTAGPASSNGNLDIASSSTAGNKIGTFLLTSGKWYWECSGDGYAGAVVGVGGEGFTGSMSSSGSKAIGYWFGGGIYWDGGSYTSGIASYTTTDVIGVAVDMTAGTVTFYKNNTLVYTATFGSGTVPNLSSGVYPGFNTGNPGGSARTVIANFGQRPFAYTAPSGFKALCDTNLPAPVVAQPSTVMDVLLWSGTGGNRSFSSLNMSPDFVWIKQRNQAYTVGHQLYDIVRGAGSLKQLDSSNTTAEGGGNTDDYGYLSSFDSAGFSVTSGSIDSDYVNKSGVTYVAWAWDAGSSTVSNTDGSITSTVRANASAGFSIVTFTYPSSGSFTVGHGLNATPGLIITKHRTRSVSWFVYHSVLGKDQRLSLDTTGAVVSDSNFWGSAAISSTTFGGTVGTSGISGDEDVAYCFAPVDGYSSFGSYTGNGSATDGPFVFTGMRPRWVMIKRTNSTENWQLWDTSRDSYNSSDRTLFANLSTQESNPDIYYDIDILSNGFKLRNSHTGSNASASTYVYCAFAEHPFKTSRAR